MAGTQLESVQALAGKVTKGTPLTFFVGNEELGKLGIAVETTLGGGLHVGQDTAVEVL